MKFIKVRQKYYQFKRTFNDYINQKKEWIINYFLSPDSFNSIITWWNHYYFISSNINEIHQGIYNRKRNFICIFICLYCFLSILITSIILYSNEGYQFIKVFYFVKQFKASILLALIGLILTFAIRIDLLIEERKFKLRILKFFYYLFHNVKSKHKLTDKNYKKILIIARSLELFLIKYVVIHAIISISYYHLYLCVIHKTILPVILSPLLLILLIIVQTTFHSGTALLLIVIFYYKSLFDQIYQRIHFMFQFNFISSIEFNRIFNEHNLIAIQVNKLNLFVRRTIAVYFIASSLFKITFLHLAIHSEDSHLRLFWGFVFALYNLYGFLISYGMHSLTKSAHKSYKLIYSFLATKKLNLSMRLKVINLC